jgi:HAD superfamily hydrolase (TIGR01509 family)
MIFMVAGNEFGVECLSMPKTSQIPVPRAILFDHDGTLVASEPIHWAAWGSLLTDLEIPYNESDLQKMVGMTAPEIMSVLLDRYKPGWSADEFNVHQLAQRKNDHYLKHAQTQLKTYPGVREGLKWCHEQKIKTAVVSNAKQRELETALGWLGILGDFDLIISRDTAKASKPDPTGYLMAAASLGFEVSECIAVEDSPTGIEASLIAKIPSVAILTNFPREAMETPVLGRPDLKPIWIGESMEAFFKALGAPF